MLTINREKFEEIKNQLKEKQLVCNQIAQWKKTPLWLREMTHQPEIPPNFLNELRQIRDAIVSFEIDKNTLGLAVFYNELYKLLAPSYNVLTPIDTDHMNNHVLLLQRISNYAGKVDEHIKSLSASEVKHLDYAEFWSLLSETFYSRGRQAQAGKGKIFPKYILTFVPVQSENLPGCCYSSGRTR